MDDKVQKLLQRAINENLSADRVSYIMQYNGYDQEAIDAALGELSKKKRPVLFQRQYDSSGGQSNSQQVGPPNPNVEEPVPSDNKIESGEPVTFDEPVIFDQGTGGMSSDKGKDDVEVSVGDWWGDKWNGLVEGVSDFMYYFDKEQGNNKEQIAEFVELSKEKYPDLYNSYQQNLQSDDLISLGYDSDRNKREAAGQAYADFWQTNPEIENEVVPFIRERRREQDVEDTGIKIDKAVTKELDSRFLSGAVKGLAGSIPAMVTAGTTMGGSFMTTSYYASDEELKRTFAENPDLKMTKGQQEAYKLTVAGIEGVLEKIGLSGALKGTSVVKSLLAKKVFSRLASMGDDVGSEAFERIVKQEAKGLKGYLKKTATGTLSEAETGALQQLSVDLINETVNGLSGQEVFTPKSAMTIIQDAIYAGAQEAVGGGIMSGSVGAFSNDITTQEDFDAAEEFIGRIEISKLEENLDKRVSDNKISEAEKENILNTAKEFKQTMAKVPEDVDQKSKRRIYQLINQKMKIQEKTAGKDEAIQNKAKESIEGINQEIANLYEVKSQEQAAQPTPAEAPQPTEAAQATDVDTEVETRFYAPTIETDGNGNAVVDPGKVKEESFTGASVISKGHVDEDTAFGINSALSLLGDKAKDMKVRVFDSVESLLNADPDAANFYVKNKKMPKAYIKGSEMFVLTKNAVEQYNKAKGTNVEYSKQYIHEVGHPIVSSLVAEDPEAQDRLYAEIETAAAEGDVIAQRALGFGKNYTSQGEGKVKNETLVEFMALVTDEKRFKSLNRTTKQKIKDFFNTLLSSISSDVVIKTDAELYDVARSMRDAFRMQKAINIQPSTNKKYQQRSAEFSVDEGTTAGNRLFNKPLPEALAIAEAYMEQKGMDYDPGKSFNTLDIDAAQETAAAYDAMLHDPKNPEVKKAYEALVKETADQYDAILEEGFVLEINNNEPYSSSKDMIEDLASNKRMKIFSTESGFGSEVITDDQRADNPLLRDSGYKDVNGQTLLMNDVFRFVHDFFGHSKRGNGFGPKGEENAWDVHSRMYTPIARRAMTSETRGQNSWVNFSGVNEEAFKVRDKARKLRKEGRTNEAAGLIEQVYEMMSFAEQKIGLMPEKYTANPYIKGGDPDFASLDFSLDDVKGTEKIVPGNTANTVINKAKRTEKPSLSVNDIDYSKMSTTAQPIGLAKKMLSGTFKYKKKTKTETKNIILPIGIKDKGKLDEIEILVDKVRAAKGKDAAIAKAKLGKAVESSIMEIKEFMKANVRMLYNSLTPDFIKQSKQWYDGANRIAQQFKKDYPVTIEQASGILAALSPQNDWFNNITNAYHVMEVMTKYKETKITQEIVDAAVKYSNSKATKGEDSPFSIRLKKLYAEIGDVSISDLDSINTNGNKEIKANEIAKANLVRAFSLATLSQENKTIDPEGNVVGSYGMPHTWMTDSVIVNAMNIFNDGSPEMISQSLGNGNKVRNFYNNIVDPNSNDEFLTADTHALAVALGSPISAADAGGFGLFGGNESITYAIVKDAYIEVAKEIGLLPRQLQSVTWEAVRTGVNNPARPKKKETLKLIKELSTSNLTYEEGANEIIKLNPSFTPEWAVKRGITAQKDVTGLQPSNQGTIDAGDGGIPPSRRSGMGGVRRSDSGMGKRSTDGVDFSTDEGKTKEIDFSTDETVDFKESKMLNEFSWNEQVYDRDLGKFGGTKTVRKTEKSDKPIAIKFPDGVIAVVRSPKDDLAAAEQLVKDVKKGLYPNMDVDQAETKRDRIRQSIKDKDITVELIDGDMKYHADIQTRLYNEMKSAAESGDAAAQRALNSGKNYKGKGYGRSAMPIGQIRLVNNHFDYYFPEVAKLLGKDYKDGLLYSPDDTRGGDAVYIYDEFQGKGFGSRLYFSALRLLNEQYPGARLISNHDLNVKTKAKNFWRTQVKKGLARVIANTATEKEIAKVGPEVLKQLKDIGSEYTGDIYELIDPTDFSTDEGINWYESPEGKGDPSISRRDNQLEEAAQDLKAGRLKNYEFREMAKALSPIEQITRFFAPATTERMAEALDKNKLSSLNESVKDGEIVALRLDIPAYIKNNTWIVSIHDGLKSGGKIISYRSVARITDVVFKSRSLAALNIASGLPKDTIGRMFGKYKNLKGETPEAMAEDAKSIVSEIWNDKSWVQIGMNPTRASYFYDRRTGRPVVAAEEVVQIGGLVYAKNAVYTRWNDAAFEVKGYSDVDGAPIYFSTDEGTGNVKDLRRTVSRTIGRFKDSRERILSNPEAYYTKQSLKAIKENLELMTEDELLENMTAEGLNRVSNSAGPGKGENDISVLAAVELINRKAEAGEDVSEMLVDLSKVGTTVGRMLRHFAELKSATPLGIVATIEGALSKANRIMSSTQVERLTDIADRFIKAGQVVKNLRDEIESEYSKEKENKLIKASKELDKTTRELNKFTSLIVPKKTMDLLSTTIQGNLLTPISQITNVGANLFQIATSIPVRGFETLFSKITSKFSGKKGRSYKYTLMAIPFAIKRGGVGVAEAIETIIRGGASTDKIVHTGFLPGAAFLAAISDTKFAAMINKTLGKDVVKGDVLARMANGKISASDRVKALYEGMLGVAPEIMFRFLALGDKPFSRFAEGMEVYQQAARLGLKGDALKNYIKYPNKKQKREIEEAGRRLTFQQDSTIATGFFGATNWLEKQGGVGKAVAFALKLTMPYVKTPANIFTETLKFAVPGIGMASAIRHFQNKKWDEGSSDLAKAATGQILVMAANALISSGLVSGAFGDEDEEERALKYLKFPPMSINKSGLIRLLKGENPDYRDGDVFMRYDKFGIVGMVIGARVTSIENNLIEAKGKEEGYYVGKKEKGFFEPFSKVFDEIGVGLGTVQFLNSQSFLTGANGLLSVLSGEASEYDVEKWFENTFRSLTAIPLPNTLSAVHRSVREYMPNIKTKSVENKFKYILMDRLFDADGIPVKIDLLGNKIPQTPEGSNKWMFNLMDFTKTQKTRDQFIINEIYRLYELQEDARLIPGFPSKINKIPTKHPETSAKITGWNPEKEEEYRNGIQGIQEVYAKNRADILDRLFKSDSYSALTNERKQERVIETLQKYDRGYVMIKALPGSGQKNLKPPMEWAKMLNELNNQYFN